MSVLTAARLAEFEAVQRAIGAWAAAAVDVVGVALVGSWARDAARMDSDVDVVVLTESDRFVTRETWVTEACGEGAALVRTEDWGALTERRVRLPSGFEIEFGFALPTWAATAPVDPGTRRVISDGCIIWHDPGGLFGRLVDEVRS